MKKLLMKMMEGANTPEERTKMLEVLSEICKTLGAEEIKKEEAENVVYLYTREQVTTEGVKHYHPLVGGMQMSSNPEDYKMEAYSSILELQESRSACMARMAENQGYKMKIIAVPSDTYLVLQDKLLALVTELFELVDKAAEASLAAETLLRGAPREAFLMQVKQLQLQKLFNEPLTSKQGVTAENEIVSADSVAYVADEKPEYDDDDDDDWDDENHCCCDGCSHRY